MTAVIRNPYAREIAAYCKPMRPDREEIPGRDDLTDITDEFPVCDPPTFPISQKDD